MSSPLRKLDLGGRAMIVDDRGGRPAILFVHGFPFDHAVWGPQLTAFAPEHRVVAPDLVGFGRSSPEGRPTVDAHADDLAMALDRLGIASAVVVGLSMGGYIALAMARRRPERVAGLVLACSRAGADSEAARAARYHLAIAVEERGVGVVADALLPRMLAPGAPAELVESVRAMMHRQPSTGVVAALKAMAARPSAVPQLALLHVPTLIVAGAADTVIPKEESARMAALIPGSRLVVVPGAGHVVSLEAPGAFNNALDQFLPAVGPL